MFFNLGLFRDSSKTGNLKPAVYDYLLAVSVKESAVLKQLREETAKHRYGSMQIAPDQGQFMALLVRLIGAKKVLEIGTFTGYSALWFASALSEDGKVITCDIDPETTAIAKTYWHMAEVDKKIELRLAPALETLEQLLQTGQDGTFDFAFIDADKENYLNYYKKTLDLLRPGGLMAIDNVLWGGAVANPKISDRHTQAIREFNQFLHQDKRVELSMLAIADGLTLARKLG